MADTGIEVKWQPEAEKLLRKRDHYIQGTIKKEFKDNPIKDAIEFDLINHSFVTPVADRRYIVIWDMEQMQDKKLAKVRAVVPTQLFSEDPAEIKAQVNELVELESRGAVKLY